MKKWWILVIVPDAPERVKWVVSGENAVVISWLPPRRPNGLLTQYTVYIRMLEQGQDKIIKNTLPAQNLHHEATGLKLHESYEAWVTASTKVGQGSSTPVVKFQPSTTGKPVLRFRIVEKFLCSPSVKLCQAFHVRDFVSNRVLYQSWPRKPYSFRLWNVNQISGKVQFCQMIVHSIEENL